MLLPIDVFLLIMYRAKILVTSSTEKITGIIILKKETRQRITHESLMWTLSYKIHCLGYYENGDICLNLLVSPFTTIAHNS